MTIKAIETSYNGYRFRSRLEARWAVYFDRDGIQYEYEPQGYDLAGLLYLPDFWLPQVQMWAEVKPAPFSKEEIEKSFRLFAHTGHPVLFLVGLPGPFAYKFTQWLESRDGLQYFTDRPGVTQQDRCFNDCYCSSYHDYPETEGRFYTNTGESDSNTHLPDKSAFHLWAFESNDAALIAARSARFEHGESPR